MRSGTRPLTLRSGLTYEGRPGRLTATLTIFGCRVTRARGVASRWVPWAAGETGRLLVRFWLAAPGARPSTSAWFSAPAEWWSVSQRTVPSQAEAMRTEPATAATVTRAALFRARGADLRCRTASSGRAGVDRWAATSGRVSVDLWAATSGRVSVDLWAATSGRSGVDRDDFRCRACAWDTIDLRSGAGDALSPHPVPAWQRRSQLRVDPERVQGGRIAGAITRWVLLTNQSAPLAGVGGPELRKRQLPLRHVDHSRSAAGGGCGAAGP